MVVLLLAERARLEDKNLLVRRAQLRIDLASHAPLADFFGILL